MKRQTIGVAVLALAVAANTASAATLTFDFDSGPGQEFSVRNDGGLYAIDLDGPDLRIAKPADDATVNPTSPVSGGVQSEFLIDGDFAVTVDFTLHSLPLAGSQKLNESVLRVLADDDTAFWILRFTLGNGNRIETFADFGVGNSRIPAMHHSSLMSGRYRLSRSGATIAGYYAESGSSDFTSLGGHNGFTEPMRIELLASQLPNQLDYPRPTTPLDISFDNLFLEAEAIIPDFHGVIGRHVFYDDSAFDVSTDVAIAVDKQPLLPGQTATFSNYTSHDLGINGIMVDIGGLENPDGLNLDTIGNYLGFRVGNDDNPDGWEEAPSVRTVGVRPGEGVDTSDRITITWPDYAIQNEWLQVTVLANEFTGLEEEDVFYFGNVVAEAGNSGSDTLVTTTDLLLARNNPRTFLDPAGIDFPYDYNRDQRVNTTDLLLARNNTSNFLTSLKLITAPGEAGMKVVPEPGTVALLLAGVVVLVAGTRKRRLPVSR